MCTASQEQDFIHKMAPNPTENAWHLLVKLPDMILSTFFSKDEILFKRKNIKHH